MFCKMLMVTTRTMFGRPAVMSMRILGQGFVKLASLEVPSFEYSLMKQSRKIADFLDRVEVGSLRGSPACFLAFPAAFFTCFFDWRPMAQTL